MVHHLQQHVEDVRVRLLDLVEQQYRVRLLGDRLGEQPALLEADVSRRCADEARHRVPLHVLGHVEADQLDAHAVRELPRHFRLADAGGSREQEVADRLLRVAQARACHLDRRGQGVDRLVLAEHHGLEVAVEVGERAAVVGRNASRRDARDLGDDLLDLGLADDFLLLRLGRDALRRAGFVDDVDCLVRQVTVVDVARRQLGGGRQRVGGVLDAMVGLEAGLQALQDLHRLVDRRLHDVDLLEAA